MNPKFARNLAPVRWTIVGRDTVKAYFEDKIPRHGAALAFYTTVAVAPLMMVALVIAGTIFGHDSARREFLLEIQQLSGMSPDQAFSIFKPIEHPPSAAAWGSLIVFLFGGFGVFSNLQDSLNTIWRAPRKLHEKWPPRIKRQVFSLAAVIGTGFIVLVSLSLSASLAWLVANATERGKLPVIFTEGANLVLSFGVIALLMAVIFKFLPNISIRWHDVWVGAGLTSVLFNVGKTVLAYYVAHTRVTSAYGAAGSAIALLLWCYYAAQIVFFGAEFTRIYAFTQGGRVPRRSSRAYFRGSFRSGRRQLQGAGKAEKPL